MKLQRVILLTVFTLVMVVSFDSAIAQCAMCKASVENNVADGSSEGLASGLNFGIIYLFLMPYIAIAVVGYFWYRSSRKDGNHQTQNFSIKERIRRLVS